MFDFDATKIFLTKDKEATILELFRFQYQHNAIYQAFVNQLQINIDQVTTITQIPFLPIQFFKTKKITTTDFEPAITFTSSGTTGATSSSHHVKDLSLYNQAFTNGWNQFYQPIENYCVIGLLPSYLEREGSSLIHMVDNFIKKSNHELSDFYLDEHEHLYLILNELEKDQQPTLLIGVTFALLDFAAKFNMQLKHTIIMETGGMKGRGKELTRTEVHHIIKTKLGCHSVHSEYGMTELLSQAYSKGDGIFYPSNTMQVLVRSQDDPLQVSHIGKGMLNIIDLANVYSCSFIAADDITQIHENGSFEIKGRADHADMRGCSLLVT